MMQKAGLIRDLETQVVYELVPKCGNNRPVTYRADFRYLDTERDEIVVEDCKGVRTDTYKLKRKLMRWVHGIEIKET